MALIATFIFLYGVRNEEEECEPLGGPRLYPVGASSGPRRIVGDRVEWNHQSANCCAAKPVGQSWADNCERTLTGNVPYGHRKGVVERTLQLRTNLANADTLKYKHTL